MADEQQPDNEEANIIAMLGTVIRRQEEIEEAQQKIRRRLDLIEARLGIS